MERGEGKQRDGNNSSVSGSLEMFLYKNIAYQ